jgi:hypothetical protein
VSVCLCRVPSNIDTLVLSNNKLEHLQTWTPRALHPPQVPLVLECPINKLRDFRYALSTLLALKRDGLHAIAEHAIVATIRRFVAALQCCGCCTWSYEHRFSICCTVLIKFSEMLSNSTIVSGFWPAIA